MTAPVLLRGAIVADSPRKDVDLLGNKRNEPGRRSLVGPQRTAGMAQVAEHQGVAETVVITAVAPDQRDVRR